MKIKKIINNNLVQSFDNSNKEVLVMGCGLGFKKKIGDIIDKDKVEKIYSLDDKNYSNKLIELLSDIPLEVIQTTNEIVAYARYSLGKKLNDNIYILLTDHINFAMERAQKGLQYKNALLWEIKRFYNHEFLIGKEALQIIKKKLNVDLSEDEAANIALHIVNAQLNSSNMDDTMNMTNMIQNIINIVKFHYKIELYEYSLHYERFITHLKFFSQRIFTGKEIEDEDTSLSEIMKEKFKEAYKCAEKIKKYIKSEFDSNLNDEEMMYLAVHINRVTKQTE